MATRVLIAEFFTVASCLLSGAPGALAQKGPPATDYPNRPIRIVVPFTPGGPEELDELVKQQIAVVAKLARAAGLKPE